MHKHRIKQHIYVSYNLSFDWHPTPSNFLFNCRLAIFIKKVYNTDMKPRAHRVCTFSRLFSDFQNSSALRNTTESCHAKGRSCFAPGSSDRTRKCQSFSPNLSKAEKCKTNKKYPGHPCFPRFPAPCEAEHRRQPGRPHFAAFDHTGADSVSRLHFSKGRRRSRMFFAVRIW